MDIEKIGSTNHAPDARARSLPALASPLSAFESVRPFPSTGGQYGRAGQRRLHHRPSAAFLAQLSLQYDGVVEARRARRARRQEAATSYAPSSRAGITERALGALANLKA